MVQSIENIIVNSIKKCGRGAVFFPSDFSKVGERSAVLKALKQMTDRGVTGIEKCNKSGNQSAT